MPQFREVFIWAVSIAAVSLSFAGPASAATATVDCDRNPGALAAALTAAAPGDTIQIVGTCRGQFTISVNLTLVGRVRATVDGNGAGPVITVPAGVRAVLEDLTITGGASVDVVAVGGINNSGQLEIRKSRVIGNSAQGLASATGGIASGPSGSAWLSIDGSQVSGNTASVNNSAGGGTAAGGVRAAGPLTVSRSEIRGNDALAITSSANRAFGGIVLGPGLARIESTVISENNARSEHTGVTGTALVAGAIGGLTHLPTDALTIDGSVIQANHAVAISAVGSGSAGGMVSRLTTITRSSILDNTAEAGTFAVAGIGNHNAPLILDKSTVSGNSARAWDTGGVAGGGIVTGYIDAANTTIIKSAVTDNTAIGADAAGGLYVVAVNGSYALDKSSVSGNAPVNCNFSGCQP